MRRLNFVTLIPFLLALAIIGYLLPWVITPAQSLSMGAYDLAEWTSLHPVVRQTLPFLWATLALRIPLAILGTLLATYIASSLHRTVFGLVVLPVATLRHWERGRRGGRHQKSSRDLKSIRAYCSTKFGLFPHIYLRPS